MVVEGPIAERFANEKMVVEISVAENTVKKMEVDSLLVILLGVEDFSQAAYSDGSLFFHFSNSDIGFNGLNRSCAEAHPIKEQKYIKEKKTNTKKNRSC